MNSLIFLVVICIIYYCINHYFPDKIEERYHYYFGGFVIVYCIILYFLIFESEFMFKIFKNVYETSNQPLYSFNASQSNADFFYQQNPNHNIKDNLAIQQGYRCQSCNNLMMKQDVNNYLLKYKTPLQRGDPNDISNLGVVCPTCFSFSQ